MKELGTLLFPRSIIDIRLIDALNDAIRRRVGTFLLGRALGTRNTMRVLLFTEPNINLSNSPYDFRTDTQRGDVL